MFNNKPIKDRLSEKLKQVELIQVKHALYSYLGAEDPDLKRTTEKNFDIDYILPYLKTISPVW